MNAPLQSGLRLFLERDAWWRRAAFSAIYPDIIFEHERQMIADALYWLQPSDADVRVMDRTFARTLRLVRGITVSDRLSGV